MSTFGLIDSELRLIHGELRDFPEISEVIIFGSRALGTYRPQSDTDLSIVGSAHVFDASNGGE